MADGPYGDPMLETTNTAGVHSDLPRTAKDISGMHVQDLQNTYPWWELEESALCLICPRQITPLKSDPSLIQARKKNGMNSEFWFVNNSGG